MGWNFDLTSGEKFQFAFINLVVFMVGIMIVVCVIFKIQKNYSCITEKNKNGKYPPLYVDSSEYNRIGKVRKLTLQLT